jgi:hypothetical protein
MSATAAKLVLVVLVVGLDFVSGCGGGKPKAGGTAGNGVARTTGMAGSSAAGATGAAGSSTAGEGGGAGGSGGLAGSDAGGTGGAAGSSTGGVVDGGASGSGGGGGSGAGAGATDGGVDEATVTSLGFAGSDITKVVPTPGCGKPPAQALGTLVRNTIQTSGTKAPDCHDTKCGAWSYEREYYLQLPANYDPTTALSLIVEGPGCGGKGNNIYPLPSLDTAVIRVGLSPSVEAAAFTDRVGQGCFDFNDGDNSVDWPFYENLYDRLASQICFDRNRAFVIGSLSGGGRFADELGCKYAGDATRPVRGVMANTGGLLTDPKQVPTCTTKPMAGMWIHEIGDTQAPFSGAKLAIARAMQVNGCTIGTGFDDAEFDIFPIADNPDGTCKRIKGCPNITPLVVCPISGNNHTYHANIATPGFSSFIELFLMPPLLGP